MASDYGRNFGFRRSDEAYRWSEGRYKTPTGTPLLIGSAVTVDFSNAGRLAAAAANATPEGGVTGLLVSEEFVRSIYDSPHEDSYRRGTAKANAPAVITGGPAVKVWFKNTALENRVDGRTVPAVELVDFTSVVRGSLLGWNGTQFDLATANKWMRVLETDGSTYVEATLVA